jgi:hypothetical protein
MARRAIAVSDAVDNATLHYPARRIITVIVAVQFKLAVGKFHRRGVGPTFRALINCRRRLITGRAPKARANEDRPGRFWPILSRLAPPIWASTAAL